MAHKKSAPKSAPKKAAPDSTAAPRRSMPPVAPAPTYGAGGSKYVAPKPAKPKKEGVFSRLKRFRRGDYTKP